MTQSNYEIARATSVCAATGRPLNPGDPFVAALFEAENDTLERRDYSADSWTDTPAPPGLFAYWRGTVPQPARGSGLALPFDSLLDLFDQLESAEDPRRVAFRFVLALLLSRKRLLSIVGERRATPDRPGALLVRPRGAEPTDPPIEVTDPALDEAALAGVTEQVAEVLSIDP
ncbi:MAG TPA: hypothetical protein DEB06_03990 [Phycisphaerales bacterium]|nr:hypothetical protein [Phycisphaerales bacterium]